MTKKIISINNILGGWATSDYITRKGEFLSSIGIDPDMPADDNGNKPSGLIRPTSMAEFSGANVNAVPLWIFTNPKDNKIYVLLSNGKFISYTNLFASETLIATLTTCSGNGMAYYDNAFYLARNTNIGKYAPLHSSPSMDDDYWTAVLSKAVLVDTTYPSINGIEMPNHPMHRHTDNKLYIADVVGGKGVLHFIKTKKTTNEGDTDDGSTASALDFGYGEYPTAIETHQTDLVIALIEGVDTTTKQKPAKLSFWNTTDDSFSSITSVELSDPLITALKNVNGVVYVFSGNAKGGCRVSKIVSGYQLEEIIYLPEVYPPLQGAVDHIFNRIAFGSNTVEPESSGSVFSLGAKEKQLPMGLHNIARLSLTGANPMITAIKYPTQDGAIPPLMIGGKDDAPAYNLEKYSTTYGNYNVFRSDVFIVDKEFTIEEIRIPFAQAIAANMTLKVKIYFDDASNTPSAGAKTLRTINNTNYPNGDRFVRLQSEIRCKNNFFIQLEWEGSSLLTVSMPLQITIDINED